KSRSEMRMKELTHLAVGEELELAQGRDLVVDVVLGGVEPPPHEINLLAIGFIALSVDCVAHSLVNQSKIKPPCCRDAAECDQDVGRQARVLFDQNPRPGQSQRYHKDERSDVSIYDNAARPASLA